MGELSGGTEYLDDWRYDCVSPLAEDVELLTSGWVIPHEGVHGRSYEDGFGEVPGPEGGGEEVVGQAVGQLGQSVGGERSHETEVGPPPELYMKDRVTSASPGAPLVLVSEDGEAGSGQAGEVGEEVTTVLGEDNFHLTIVQLAELVQERGELYSGHTSRTTQQYVHHPLLYH